MEIGFDWLIARIKKSHDEANNCLLELSTGFAFPASSYELDNALQGEIWAVKTDKAPVKNGQMPIKLGRVLAAVKLEDASESITLFNLDKQYDCGFVREKSGEVFLPNGRFQVKGEVPPGTVFKGLQSNLTTVLIESAYKENN